MEPQPSTAAAHSEQAQITNALRPLAAAIGGDRLNVMLSRTTYLTKEQPASTHYGFQIWKEKTCLLDGGNFFPSADEAATRFVAQVQAVIAQRQAEIDTITIEALCGVSQL